MTTDNTEGMTPLQRAESYEAEAAQMIDRTIRKLPEGVETEASRKLVSLIVEAAVLRIKSESSAPAVPRCVCGRPLSDGDHEHPDWMMALKPSAVCPKTYPIGRGDHGEIVTGDCTLTLGHEGKCQLQSARGIPYVMPGEIDHEPNPETRRAQSADRVEFNQQNRCHVSGVAGICYLPHGHDGDHMFR